MSIPAAPGESLFQQLSRNIYTKCTDALRRIGANELFGLASFVPAAMTMIGAASGASYGADMAHQGHAVYQAYLDATRVDSLGEGVARALTGGFESTGVAAFWAGSAGMIAFPSLAMAAKAVVHAFDLGKPKPDRDVNIQIEHEHSGPSM
ncbi:hypothetical protein C1X35_18845 [Pseudomonas sp. FW306-1C-G01A]|uniref:hypothetical protein n=1 Tax=unclassified Pseudomonas TaxID=196821 RepID=UPI000C86C5AE|nr:MULTISPECIES: hypothetical protein [unclassified Pseudomonas]PMV79761.1 hypothetical protein C1X56_31735 [Pseudomonas sp. GW101-1A09]PMV85537.1 hypothetical protein C1X51_30105 [Pseudomonas sp. FW306-2-2C-B10A]PMW04315.1 hypothetical protein C1X50_17820 [Pseudomonas sp. MPR-TSA4]PMW07259.1 hypothetical protein C1X52_30570 [Pseudomonas sp. FW306-2-1A-C05A]PMW27771.1 hypothetical protein C1X48_33320 [Pseudomonas sp. FW305-3-2-15-A-R2A1]